MDHRPITCIEITEIGIDKDLGLYVKPDIPLDKNYLYIWREAQSVRWDHKVRALYVVPVPTWTHIDCYRQIVKVLQNEYDEQLVLSRNTTFIMMDSDLIEAIQNGE